MGGGGKRNVHAFETYDRKMGLPYMQVLQCAPVNFSSILIQLTNYLKMLKTGGEIPFTVLPCWMSPEQLAKMQ